MKIKSQKDFWSGLMFVVAGLAFAVGALNYRFGRFAAPGPAFVPLLLGMLLSVLGGLLMFKALAIEVEGGDPIATRGGMPALAIIGAVALFGIALPRLGLVMTAPLVVALASLANSGVTWRSLLLQVAVVTGLCLAGVVALSLKLPLWPVFA